jgi:hypothetical protein
VNTRVKDFIATHFQSSFTDQDFHNSLNKYIVVLNENENRLNVFEQLISECLTKLYQTIAYVLETELDIHTGKLYLNEIFQQV